MIVRKSTCCTHCTHSEELAMRVARISDTSASVPPDASGGTDSDAPTLAAFVSESWFTAEGARLKARRLQQAGLPNMANWRFVTLTVADRSVSPLAVYLRGKERMRRFLARLREAIGDFLWCWKLEFHDDEFPHWHLCIEYRKRVPEEMLSEIESWWGLGRVNVERIKSRQMYYVFKYVSKGVDELPIWVTKFKGRLRVFQTSRGFFTRRKQRVVEKKEPVSCMVRTTIGTRLGWDERRALLTTYVRGEKRVSCVRLRMTFAQLLLGRALNAIRTGVPMAYPDRVTISHHQELILKYENRRFGHLATIPCNSEYSDTASNGWSLPLRAGDLCAA